MWIAACPVAQHTSAFVRPVETTSQTSVSHTWCFQETCSWFSCSFHPKPSAYLGSSTSSTSQWTNPSGLVGSVATGLLDVFSTAMKPFALFVRLQHFDGHEVDWISISLQIFKVFLWKTKRGLIVDMEWLVSTTKCYQPSRKMEQPENIWLTNRPLSAVTATRWSTDPMSSDESVQHAVPWPKTSWKQWLLNPGWWMNGTYHRYPGKSGAQPVGTTRTTQDLWTLLRFDDRWRS
jgi:hypothetical protein